ncbi:O-antigen ligase domain-containing protein [bacterium]|nr:MAG: O-antigen ligase domain-containing protein [bacterium]
MYILIVLIIIALVAILLWFRAEYEPLHAKDDRLSIPAILLALWIIAGPVFGVHFFVLRVAGLTDITIERLLFSMILIFLGVGLLKGKVRFQGNMTIEITMGIFALICLVSMVRTGFLPISREFASPWSIFITGYLFPFIVFVFAKNYIVSEKDVVVIFQMLFYFGIYLSIMAFFEYADLRQFVFPQYIKDPLISIVHLDRARGPFLNSALNGFGILIGFICGLHFLQKKRGFAKVIYLAALLIFFPAVYFTQTRSVYLGMIVTLYIFLAWYRMSFPKWKLISLPLAVVLIVGLAYSPRLLSSERREGGVAQMEEVDVRLALMRKSYFLLAEQPFTGIGLAQFVPSSFLGSYKGPVSFSMEGLEPQLQHNNLLGIATELGIPGFLAYLALIILILRRLRQLKGKLPETGIMGSNLRIAIFAIWCVFLETGLFLETSVNIFIHAVPFLFAGLADGLYTRSLESGLLSYASMRMSQPPMRIISSHV